MQLAATLVAIATAASFPDNVHQVLAAPKVDHFVEPGAFAAPPGGSLELTLRSDMQIAIPVTIGEHQVLHLIPDTGSANFWALSKECVDATCESMPEIFDPSKSKTFIRHDVPVEIAFGTGSLVGYEGEDVVKIGEHVILGQHMFLVTHEKGDAGKANVFKSISFEGILGLSFPEMNNMQGEPPLARLLPMFNKPVFGFMFNNDSEVGYLMLGDYPTDLEPQKWIPVTKPWFWEIKLEAFQIGNTYYPLADGTAILDSGTTYNAVPSLYHSHLMESINSNSDVEIIYHFEDGIRVRLTPELYLHNNKPGFMTLDIPNRPEAFVLGSLIHLRNFATVFWRDGDRGYVGFLE